MAPDQPILEISPQHQSEEATFILNFVRQEFEALSSKLEDIARNPIQAATIEKVNRLQAAVAALAAKLDAENVTNLDKNYGATVAALL